jgi:hypothetical protein
VDLKNLLIESCVAFWFMILSIPLKEIGSINFSVLGTNNVSLGGIKNMKVFKRVVGDGFLVLNTLI